LGRRGIGASGHRRPARPGVVVQHQLLVVGERLPAATDASTNNCRVLNLLEVCFLMSLKTNHNNRM
jgi:hypothetical protein